MSARLLLGETTVGDFADEDLAAVYARALPLPDHWHVVDESGLVVLAAERFTFEQERAADGKFGSGGGGGADPSSVKGMSITEAHAKLAESGYRQSSTDRWSGSRSVRDYVHSDSGKEISVTHDGSTVTHVRLAEPG